VVSFAPLPTLGFAASALLTVKNGKKRRAAGNTGGGAGRHSRFPWMHPFIFGGSDLETGVECYRIPANRALISAGLKPTGAVHFNERR
jgi:hypothetical protein